MGDTPTTATAAATSSTAPAAAPTTAPRQTTVARLRSAGNRPWVLELLALGATCLLSVIITVIGMQLWESPDLRVPFQTAGDSVSLLSAFKGFHDYGWVWTNDALGAPFGQQYYDYGSIGPDNLHWVMAWALSRVASQPGTIYNGILLISFPMAAAAAYAALRWLDIGRLASIVAATLFAVAPYHFLRGLGGHLLLAESAAVPLGVYLAIAVAMRKALWARRERGGRLTRWASGTSLRTAALIVIVASSGIYYAAFAIMFVLVAMVASRLARSDKNFTVFNGGAVLVGIGLVLVFNLLPTVLYHRIHGSNPMTGQRSASESLTYGLNLIGEVLPPPWHRLHAFRALSDKYWHDTGLPSEGSAWGGTMSTLGLLLLAASLMATLVGATASRWLVDARLRAAALIALTGVLLGATGAGGAFISYVINPSLRAWNRISIVLVFCSLLAVAMALDALWRRAQARGRRASIAFVAMIPAIIAFGAWDQTSPMATKPDYAQARQQWSTDAHFVQAISASLGGHGEVYQIPYLPFPESPPIFNMGDYSPMRGYLHAGKGIKWSYGAMKGRPGDWQQEASALPLDEQIPAVALAGFDGLWVDTAGYTNADTQAVTPLRTITGQQPIMSADARFAYFDLRPLRTSLQKRLPGPEVKTVGPELLHPLQSTYGDGFYNLEQNPDTTWYWARSHASIKLDNPATRPRKVQFSAHLSSFARADVQVTLDGRPVATTVSTKLPGHPVKLTFTVPVGPHVLTLSTNARATKFGNDARDLRLQVLAPQVADAAFADLAPPPRLPAKKHR